MADASLIAIRMRLTGGSQVVAETDAVTASQKRLRDEQGRFIKGSEQSSKTTERTTKRTAANLAKTATSLKAVGRGLSTYVTLPLLGVAAVSGKMALDFDRNMRNVNSIAQLPEKRFDALKQKVLDLAGPTAQAPNTLAEGLYDLVSSGFDASESVSILKKSALAASAGLTTTEVSTKAVAAALNAYHLKASAAGSVSDTLFETVNRGVLTFDQLSTSIGDALPFAAQLGVSLNQVGAAISTMTKQGLSAPESVTRLKNVMVTLIKPGKDLEKALDSMNTSGAKLVQKKGLQGALEAVIGTTDGSKASIAALFPNIRALGGVLALTGKSAKSAHEDLAAFKDTTGATAKVLKQQEKSFGFQMQRAWSSLQAVLIEIGTEVLPIVIPPFLQLVHAVKDGITWFSALPGPIKQVGGELLILAAVAGPMLLLAGSLAKAALALQALGAAGSAAGVGGILGKGRLAGGAAGIAAGIGGQAIGGKGGEALSNIGGGAGLGFAVGGPVGAAVGAGLGAAVTFGPGLLDEITSSSETMQEKASAAFRQVGKGMGELRSQGHRLVIAEHAQVKAHQRARIAVNAQGRAFAALELARKQSGPMSHKVIAAEQHYAHNINAATHALRLQAKARRAHGAALLTEKEDLSENILIDRHAINTAKAGIKVQRDRLSKMRQEGRSVTEMSAVRKALLSDENKLRKAHKNLNEVYAESSEKVGPKYTKYLHGASQMTLRYGSVVKGLRHELEAVVIAEEELSAGQGRGIVHGARRKTERELERAVGNENSRHRIPHRALGGSASGLTLVGEQGPELAYFKRPTQIIPAGRTRYLLAGRGEAPRTAQAARQFRGAEGRPRLLAPITIKIGRRELAEIVAETTEDAEARL